MHDHLIFQARVFLVAKPTSLCPLEPTAPCTFTISVSAADVQAGLGAYVGIQVVNRASNVSDENMQIISPSGTWNVRDNLINFPLIVRDANVQLVSQGVR